MKLQKKVGHLSFSFGSEILNTLNNAFTYALGLLTYELIQELSKKEWDNSKFFSWFIFMIIAFLLTKFKYFYEKEGLIIRDGNGKPVLPGIEEDGEFEFKSRK